MASRRSLGGGRVLGNGKGLAPPTPQPAATSGASRHLGISSGLISPSESSVSLGSHTSSTQLSTDQEDIAARAALEEHASRQAAASASSRMVCPICNEEMMTLLQLNRHIDDNHANLEEVEQDEVKTWFEQQMKKAKKFQPLAVLNQKLKGLEVFEPNDAPAQAVHNRAPSYGTRGASPSPAPHTAPREPAVDPDDVVDKSHWQRPTGHDACADPMCRVRLGPANGQVNCRHCGKLFCEEHTMYQMKLSRAAQHEPVRGMWCRVCETCYKCRAGYNDHTGYERSHMDHFHAARRKTVDKQYLEISRLEKRLTRLTQLLADPPPEPPQSTGNMIWSSLSGAKIQQKALEQSVVTWEDDASVAECPFCQQAFSQYTFRRHHCRICGRVVCGDPATSCSTEIGLDVDTTDMRSEKPSSKIAVDVRMCKDCQRTIFSKADFAREVSTQTPDQRAYNNLLQFEQGIRLLLPKFQRLLLTLQDPDKPPTPTQLADATKVRKRLMDAFTQYDFAARRIRDLPTQSPTQERLQKAIHAQATNFLHIHMLPLKSLPKIMRHATPNGRPSPSQPPSNPNNATKPQPSALAQIKYNTLDPSSAASPHRPPSSRNSSASSAALTALEIEEKELRERLIVLEEQKFFVSEMIADANKRRRFDEVGSLAQNLRDLDREVDGLQGRLSGMDFAGAWREG